jgi:hypothetical protein
MEFKRLQTETPEAKFIPQKMPASAAFFSQLGVSLLYDMIIQHK